MNEEKYQNGDIYWNKYDGTFKAFDKDGNEIKFPTEDTGYQVKLDVQGILNLYEKNKELKRIEELRIAQIENLKQENKELHSVLEEIKNNFMCFRSCITPFHVGEKDNLPHKMADVIQNYCESIINKINEVLE